ncbi:MAG: cell wall hydrolase, partial [Pseudomonadota bacterium]
RKPETITRVRPTTQPIATLAPPSPQTAPVPASQQSDEVISSYTQSEIDILARTIWGEARGEDYDGQVAVGIVIRNRVFSDRDADTYRGVVLRRKQFSVWDELDSPGIPQRLRSLTIQDDGFEQALRIAEDIVLQKISTPRRFVGVLHYLNPDPRFYAGGNLPSWTNAASGSFEIGNHRFYRDVPL